MARLPRISGQKLIAALTKAGFAVTRIRGSHHFLEHEDDRATVVPVHRGETIGPGLLTKILRDCEITRDDLKRLLSRK
jgi:predicted RNA binding protein YcfA (HicA-like mRNA interferase family)